MAQYRVVRDCYGFQGRYWKKDVVVSLRGDEDGIPRHFELIGGKPVAPKVEVEESEGGEGSDEPETLKDLGKAETPAEAKARLKAEAKKKKAADKLAGK